MAGYEEFSIRTSEHAPSREAFVSPDIALCDDCTRELLHPNDIRHHYPFITCTNCGPRFSIVEDIPYDRPNTSMKSFPMCPRCQLEYNNPLDRRFHAQPNACPRCGPHLELRDHAGGLLSRETDGVIDEVLAAIRNGSIVAIKSVGGYCIACDAENERAVRRLRERKGRPFKPFALMAGSIDTIERCAEVSREERKLLLSRARPIVLLKKRASGISPIVAPGLSYYGFMLPYAPVHYLLFEKNPNMIIVMTSGNIVDEPIIYRDDDALRELSSIADCFVSYNREIVAQSDDSVVFVENDMQFFVRRSRGYVPAPMTVRTLTAHILATGGDLKNSFALARDDFLVLGQYIGDLSMASGDAVFRRTLSHYMKLYDFKPEAVVSDMHPSYFTSFFADELESKGMKRFSVQHHHAHIASVLEEHNTDGPVIGIAFDGTGFGTDGTLWGSEFLIVQRDSFERAAHFAAFPLPGGESAIRDVWKIGVSLLKSFAPEALSRISFGGQDALLEIIQKGINAPLATSVGRLFDGIAALLGIRASVSTEAEAAMLLEEAAYRGSGARASVAAPFDPETGVIDTGHFVRRAVELLNNGEDIADIARAFHEDIVRTAVIVAEHLREKSGMRTVVLSGGAFHNRLLLRWLVEALREKKFDLLLPHFIPFNDGCIAVGQISIARELMRNE
jgi:hydrogenase maturation protein HypF